MAGRRAFGAARRSSLSNGRRLRARGIERAAGAFDAFSELCNFGFSDFGSENCYFETFRHRRILKR
jgi:hypothetical protein